VEVKSNQLTSRKVATAKEPGYYCDGGGLYLQVSRKYGSRNWVFRFMLNGRAREMGLGSPATFTLKEARDRARTCRQLVADGIDPIEERRRRRDAANAAVGEQMLFGEAVRRYLEVHSRTWRNAKHRQQWANTLNNYARPLRDRPISAIDGAIISETLTPIWNNIPETARRTKQRIQRVCRWVKDGMPLPNGGAAKDHHAAMPVDDVPAFMVALAGTEGLAARSLEFAVLTAARTNEVRLARWDEINLTQRTWTVPSARMKEEREHVVPLSPRAVALLKSLPRDDSGFVFFGTQLGKPLADNAMLRVLDRLRPGLTVHGFRSSFRDWAGDRTHFAHEVIEFALAHSIPDKSAAAYRRYRALEKRRKLMEAWAQYCSAPVDGRKVVAPHG
jgi:integrase